MVHQITLIPGDGIGPEVTAAARAVIEAAGVQVRWDVCPAGMKVGEETGNPLPESVFDSIAHTRIALKGPTATPFGTPYRVERRIRNADGSIETHVYPSVAIALRKELQLYANVRPARSYPGVASRYSGVDIVLFRENSEDLYFGRERMVNEDTAEALKIITRSATERMARFAADYMLRLGRKRVTIGHKSNVLKLTDGLFLKAAQQVLAAYPGITTDSRVIDALCMELVLRPETFDCLLLANLYGDIVSDLLAGVVGGLGLAPGANLGDEYAMFEAVHGTAPDIAGKDLANPLSMILSAIMLLRYIGESAAADRIDAALSRVLEEKKYVTRDLGGNAGTRRMTQAIIEKLS
ncbi:MAG: isocitrate/isopropylmalate dehydrogenase family protein [Burkholderiales bacterium]